MFFTCVKDTFCTLVRLSLSQVLGSLKYKPHNIKEMLPKLGEKKFFVYFFDIKLDTPGGDNNLI